MTRNQYTVKFPVTKIHSYCYVNFSFLQCQHGSWWTEYTFQTPDQPNKTSGVWGCSSGNKLSSTLPSSSNIRILMFGYVESSLSPYVYQTVVISDYIKILLLPCFRLLHPTQPSKQHLCHPIHPGGERQNVWRQHDRKTR